MKLQLPPLFKVKCLLFLLISLPVLISGQNRTPYYDGPYIFDRQDSLEILWVEKGYAFDTIVSKSDATVFERESLPKVNLQDLEFETYDTYTFSDVSKVLAISDVHGQYDLMIKLLTNHDIINENN